MSLPLKFGCMVRTFLCLHRFDGFYGSYFFHRFIVVIILCFDRFCGLNVLCAFSGPIPWLTTDQRRGWVHGPERCYLHPRAPGNSQGLSNWPIQRRYLGPNK